MSGYKHCETCNDFHYTDKDCPPAYHVFHPDYLGEEGKIVYGYDHYDVAIKYAEYYNSNGDYSLMNDVVEITVVKGNEKKVFNISAQPSVDYSANEIKK